MRAATNATRPTNERTQAPLDPRWRQVRRVLAIRLDNLGDFLVTTPALHAIKESLPTATLTVLVSPVGAQVARLDPDVDEVIEYDAPWVDPWQRLPHSSAREQRVIANLRARAFDAAIIFTSYHQSALPAAYMCYLADIPLRLAASVDGPGSLLTTRHKHVEYQQHPRHEVERGLDLVAAIGMHTRQTRLVLALPTPARAMAADILARHGAQSRRPLITVHPGCSMPARTYPRDLYVAVVNLLVEHLGATIVLTGAAEEVVLVEWIHDQLNPAVQRQTISAAGQLPFSGFCALIEASDLTITNNTGPMHIAAAVRTPVVALFALTNPPEQWGPWQVPHRQLYHDVPCRLCFSRVCPRGHECLRLVTPADVVRAATDLLRTRPAASADSAAPARAIAQRAGS